METKKIKTVSLEEAKEDVKAEGEAEQDVCSNVYNPKCGANKELLKLEDNNMKEAKENLSLAKQINPIFYIHIQ